MLILCEEEEEVDEASLESVVDDAENLRAFVPVVYNQDLDRKRKSLC